MRVNEWVMVFEWSLFGRCLVGLGVDMPTGLLFGWRV